jgi:RNA polymerase sigma-70 factor (sigma-E family)
LKPLDGLVRLCAVEAAPSLSEFCATEWPRLVGSLALYTGDRSLAEELAQETLIRVCLHWPQVHEADSPSAWAHRVAFNLAKSQLRRRILGRRLQRLQQLPEAHEPDTTVRMALREALARLPNVQRQVLVLRYFADLSVRDVAGLLDCPTNTVKTHTRRALEALRRAGLGPDEPLECPPPLASQGRT